MAAAGILLLIASAWLFARTFFGGLANVVAGVE